MDENKIVYGPEAVRLGGIYFMKPEAPDARPMRVKVLCTDVDSDGFVRYGCAGANSELSAAQRTSADGFETEPYTYVFAGMLGDYSFDDRETRNAERIIGAHEQRIYSALDALRLYRLSQTPTSLERLRAKLARLCGVDT